VLFFIGSNIIIQPRPSDPQACQAHIRRWRQSLLSSLDRASLTVHSFDVHGLETLSRGADTLPTGHGARPPVSVHLERQGNLAVLPAFTGGRAVLNTNAPERYVSEVLAETSAYYMLGIIREEARDATTLREVRVRVNRRGLSVRTRVGYFPAVDPTVGTRPAN
jgi:hypothetical protein